MTPSSPFPLVITGPSGLCFIGDPHLASFNPGRRRDKNFAKTILGKLEFTADLCNQHNLQPIILGDLFHVHDEDDLPLIAGLMRVLKLFSYRPVTLEGNHDKTNVRLSDKDALTVFLEAEAIYVMQKSGPWALVELAHPDGRRHRVAVGGTPYGQPLPHSFDQAFGFARDLSVDTALWITHEDLAFEGLYPGSIALHPMREIDMVVNGHIHATKKPVRMEDTAYYNPGNITRLSIDLAEHIPAVWEWQPFANPGMPSVSGVRVPELVRHVLPHLPAAEVFDFEGRHSLQATKISAGPAHEEQVSQFVSFMLLERGDERTDEAVVARENLLAVLDEQEAPEAVRRIAIHLCEEAISKHRSKA